MQTTDEYINCIEYVESMFNCNMNNGQQSPKNKSGGNYRQFHKPSSSKYEKSRYEGKSQKYNDKTMNNNEWTNCRKMYSMVMMFRKIIQKVKMSMHFQLVQTINILL